MYFAQLDKEGKCFTCYVAEEIVIENDIKYHSDSEKKVINFCNNWNEKLSIKNVPGGHSL